MVDFAAPDFGLEPDAGRHMQGGAPKRRHGGAAGADEVPVELRLAVFAAAVPDGESALLGEPAVIAPSALSISTPVSKPATTFSKTPTGATRLK